MPEGESQTMLRIKQVLTVDMVLIEITEKHKLPKVCNKKKCKRVRSIKNSRRRYR